MGQELWGSVRAPSPSRAPSRAPRGHRVSDRIHVIALLDRMHAACLASAGCIANLCFFFGAGSQSEFLLTGILELIEKACK